MTRELSPSELQDEVSFLKQELTALRQQNAILRQEVVALKRSELEQKAAFRISEAAYHARSLDVLFKQVHRIIDDMIPARNLFVAIYDDRSGQVYFPYYADEFDQPPASFGMHTPRAERGLTYTIIRDGKEYLLTHADYMQMVEDRKIDIFGTPPQCWLGVPLRTPDRIIGALVVQSYSPGLVYTQDDQTFLRFAAGQIAVTVERTRISAELWHNKRLMESISDAIITTDLEFKVQSLNYAAEQLYGWTTAEAVEKNVHELFKTEPEDVPQQVAAALAEKGIWEGELLQTTREAERINILSSFGVIYDLEGKPSGLIMVNRNITQTRRHEKRQQAFYKIAAAVSDADDLDNLYEIVHEIIGEVILASNFYIATYDQQTDLVRYPYYFSENGMIAAQPRTHFAQTSTGLTALLIRKGTALLLKKADLDAMREQELLEIKIPGTTEWLGVPLKTTDGQIIGVIAVMTNNPAEHFSRGDEDFLTFVSTQVAMAMQRKRTQDDLRDKEERYRLLLETSPDAIFYVNRDGMILFANRQAIDLLGAQSPAELLKPWVNWVVEPERRQAAQYTSNLRQEGVERHVQLHMQRLDGSIFLVELNISMIRDEDQTPRGFIMVGRDITLQKEVEESLREGEERFRSFVEQSTEGMILTNENGEVLVWNQSMENISGIRRDSVIGRPFWDLDFDFAVDKEKADPFRQKVRAAMQQVYESGEIPDYVTRMIHETYLRRADGVRRYTRQVVFPIRTSHGFQLGVSCVDLTEEKRQEKTRKAFYQVAESLVESRTLDDFYKSIHAIVGEVVPAQNFYIALYDAALESLQFVYFVDDLEPAPNEHWMRIFKPGKSLSMYLIRLGQPVLITAEKLRELMENGDIDLTGSQASQEHLMEWLGAPLKIEDRIIGLMVVKSYAPDIHFDQDSLEFLSIISNQVALAIERKRSENALRESERRLRQITDNMTDLITQTDVEGVIKYASPSWSRLVGYLPEEVLNTSYFEYLHETEIDSVMNAFAMAMNRRSSGVVEHRFRHKDGHFLWLEMHGSLILGDDNEIMGSVFAGVDITERKRREKMQQALYLISKSAVVARDLDTLYSLIHTIVAELIPANNLYIALFDPITQMVSFPYFVDEQDTPPEPSHIGRRVTDYLIRTGKPLLFVPDEIYSLVEKGEIEIEGPMPYSWLGVPLKTSDDVILGALVVQDYSGQATYRKADEDLLIYVSTQIAMAIQRKQADEGVRESEHKFRSFIEQSVDGIFLADETGRITAWNQAMENITASSAASQIGRTIWEVMHATYPPRLRTQRSLDDLKKLFEVIYRDGISPNLNRLDERLLVGADGKHHYVQVMMFPIQTRKGTMLGGVMRDVTSQKQMEISLFASQKLADLGTLAAGVAHELNSPLQVITGQSEDLINDIAQGNPIDSERLKMDLEMINRNAWRSAKIIRSLLTYARPSAEQVEMLDINSMIKDTLLLIEHQLKSWMGIRIQTDLAEDLPAIPCDRTQMSQVLINLLTNARDAMPQGGQITIVTRNDPDLQKVIVKVKDTGVGIPDELKEKIFTPFFTTKTIGKGTGLGLSLVMGIIQAHGGEISVESKLNEGTTFIIHLPRHYTGKALNLGMMGRFGESDDVEEGV
ncbi:MAG TPA: PAS domain S-box protein [Anaerolineaceae bacterium]|nr:PAS domain S-box protein [Anaerolineaceae bacterium]HPN50743.1 PAS domain S-box protein [Anaerolineaceae bacterium]